MSFEIIKPSKMSKYFEICAGFTKKIKVKEVLFPVLKLEIRIKPIQEPFQEPAI